ncbi:hypothetical protein E4U21_007670 [Claviceps maximensis]|nr:hypothetical protein E4U21_007670 [Claviceps maximensis]
MGADETTPPERVRTGSQCDMPEPAEEQAGFESATDNRKGKQVLSSRDRMQSSGRAALGNVLSDLSALGAQTAQKGTASSGTTSSYQVHQSIYGSQGPSKSKGEPSAPSSLTFKSSTDGKRADAQFNAFAEGSGTGELVHLGQMMTQPPKPAELSQQSDTDGIDVVRLLSQPERREPSPPLEHCDLTPVEAARLQVELFGSETGSPSWDQLLNFNAEFLVNPERFTTECEAFMGTSNVEEARSVWLHQWNGVLSSYTNEVWGHLGPLMMAAKSEIAKIDHDKVDSRCRVQALERLRLVLAHLRGH